ncbi:hypothetical protein NMY22_g12974 [Coprinellus aureogranulatus]|nr:hypothetical protein NMY22_g12974 [Coprinellus aureogranulatus]
MSHLHPLLPRYFYRNLDTTFTTSGSRPNDEDRCYHVWALVIEYLNYLAFQHARGKRSLTHAPQRAWRFSPKPNQFAAPPSTQQFEAGVASTSSPVGVRTRVQQQQADAVLDDLPRTLFGQADVEQGADVVVRRSKRVAADIDTSFKSLTLELDQLDELSFSSRESNASFDSDAPAFLTEAEDPTNRRIPDSTIFFHGRGETKPFYPVIVLENKSWPFLLAPFTASSVQMYAEHNQDVYKGRVAQRVLLTQPQAQEQLEAVFQEHNLRKVIYIYAIGAYFVAYEVTKEMVDAKKVPPEDVVRNDEVHYLFAVPEEGDRPVRSDKGKQREIEDPEESSDDESEDGDRFVNWKLNEMLVELWKDAIDRGG